MTIYRGPGGGGNADSDAEINDLTALTNQALAYSEAAGLEADAAALSAAAASTSASNAATSASGAATSETNAAASASSASTSASSASTSATNAASSASSASTSATNAASSASAASTSASNAAASETNAAASSSTASTYASNSAASAVTASTQASNAATSATAAAGSATNAATSATDAATSASGAATSATAAAASYDSFDDRYLGAKSADPTLDNDGNALLTGALYWNTVSNQMRVYSGSAWVISYLPADGYVQKVGDTMTGALVVSVTDNINAALRITQLGTGNALLVEDSTNPDSTPTVITNDGTVLIGTTTDYNSQLVVSSPTGAEVTFVRDDTTIGLGDNYGRVNYYGLDSSTNASGIRAQLEVVGGYDRIYNNNTDDLVPISYNSTGDATFRFNLARGSQTTLSTIVAINREGISTVGLNNKFYFCGTLLQTNADTTTDVVITDMTAGVDYVMHSSLGISYNYYVGFDINAKYLNDTASPTTINRLNKAWHQNMNYTGTTWTIAGAVLDHTAYNSDVTNFPAGAVNAAKVATVVSGTSTLLRFTNRTTPAAASGTYWSYNMEVMRI